MDGKPKLLDHMREQNHFRRYSIRTERVNCDRPLMAESGRSTSGLLRLWTQLFRCMLVSKLMTLAVQSVIIRYPFGRSGSLG